MSNDKEELNSGNLSSVWKDGNNVDKETGVKLDLIKHLKSANEKPQVKKMKQFGISFTKIEEYENPTILDIGCGIGTDVFNFSDKLIDLKRNGKIIGIDFNKEVIEGSIFELEEYLSSNKNKTKECEISIEFHNMNATELQFEDDSFDIIFISCTLQHIKREDVAKVLVEVKRVLKKGGRAVIMEPEPSLVKFYTSNQPLHSFISSTFQKLHTASPSIGGDLFHLIPISGLKINEVDSFSNVTTEFHSTDVGWVKLRGMVNLAVKMGVVATQEEANSFFDQYVFAATSNDLMCASIAFIYSTK